MRKTILRNAQQQIVATGHVPTRWREVQLAAYLEYQSTESALRTTPKVLALLTGIDEELLRADVSLCVPLWKLLDWFVTSLPEDEQSSSFLLDGVLYEHVGNLETINAGQFEALADFIRNAEGDPLLAAPQLLAVLYKRAGAEQTRAEVEAATKAFARLPMSIAYPAVKAFLRTGAAAAFSTRLYLEVAPKVAALLQTLEATSRSSGASKSFYRKLQNWLIQMWIRSVRRII